MKNFAKSSKKSKNTALSKRAENNITIVNCSVVIYAFILAFIYSMALNPQTAEGAITAKRFLMYAGVISAMAIAAYSAYKSNKSFLKYACMCAFVAISSASLIYCDHHNWGMRISVASLVVAFIFNCIYAYLTDKNIYYSSKKARRIFKTSVGAIYFIFLIILILSFFDLV